MKQPAQWFDTHCHLDSIEGDAGDVIRRAAEASVDSIVTVGTGLETSRKAIELAEQHDGVWAAVGVHPHECENFDEQALQEIVALAAHPKVVAIGEIGLDFYREFSERYVQERALRPQLEAARSLGKPVILHVRESFPEVFEALEQVSGLSMIFHCFSGGVREAEKALALGGYLSFAGNVSYKTATSIQKAAAAVPADRILVETDSPYLAPMPHRGKSNEPAYVALVGQALAAARGISTEQTAVSTTQNARKVFGIG